MHRRLLALVAVFAMLVPLTPVSAADVSLTPPRPPWAPQVDVTGVQTDEAGNEMTSLFVTSFDGTQIDLNVCRPAAATADDPVPVVLGSHGWGGQKANCLSRTGYFNSGIAFASMTQRGNGESTGQNNVMDPDFEGRDIMAVIDHLASLEWVAKDDGPGGTDPILGGNGGSYGGGFQWIGAFTDQARRGKPTRFNTLNAGNTWYDLRESLAPQDVLRTVMVNGLYAGGVRNNDLAPWITQAIATADATGLMLDGPAPANYASRLHHNSAAWFVEQGMQLDIPVRLTQGSADLVFPFNDSMNAFAHAITDRARDGSIMANHHSGHGAPGQVPTGPVPYTPRSGGTCDLPGDLEWYRHTLLEEDLDLGSRLRLRSIDGDCYDVDAFPEPTTIPVTALDGQAVTNGMRGQHVMTPVLQGPGTVAGEPTLTFTSTSTGADARLFWGLAIGTTTADAQLVDGQWVPSRVDLPGMANVEIPLGAVVADVEQGQTLYLVVSPFADQFAAHGSRVGGITLLENVNLDLPLLD